MPSQVNMKFIVYSDEYMVTALHVPINAIV